MTEFLPRSLHHDPRLWWFILPEGSRYETSQALAEIIHPAHAIPVCKVLGQKVYIGPGSSQFEDVLNRGAPDRLTDLATWFEASQETRSYEVEYVEHNFETNTILVRESQEQLDIRKVRLLGDPDEHDRFAFKHHNGRFWYGARDEDGHTRIRSRIYYVCYEAYLGPVKLGSIKEGRTSAWDAVEGDPLYTAIFQRPHNGLKCECCKGKLTYYERQFSVNHWVRSFEDRKNGRAWKRNTEVWRLHWATCLKCHPWRGSLTLCGNDGMEGAITLAGSGNLTLMEDT